MLTQDQIYEWDGIHSPVKNKPIRTMDPTPGNGWGCLQPVDIIKTLRKMAQEEGKEVTITEVRTGGRVAKLLATWLLVFIVIGMAIGILLSWAKP